MVVVWCVVEGLEGLGRDSLEEGLEGLGRELSGGGSGEDSLERTLWRTLSGENSLENSLWRDPPRRDPPRRTPRRTPHTPTLSPPIPDHTTQNGGSQPSSQGEKGKRKRGVYTLKSSKFLWGRTPRPPSTTPGPTYGREKRQEGGARAFRARSDKIDRAHRPLSNRTIPTPPSPLLPKLFNSKLSNFTWGHSPPD